MKERRRTGCAPWKDPRHRRGTRDPLTAGEPMAPPWAQAGGRAPLHHAVFAEARDL